MSFDLSHAGEEAARIAMTDDAVLALLRRHFAGAESTSLFPTITGKKELGARAVHARHLPLGERVLMLYDDTVFGSGDDGFVLTARRLCWKNVGEAPHALEWARLDPESMVADGSTLFLGEDAIVIAGDASIMETCEQVFHVLAFSARAPSGTHPLESGIESMLPTTRPSRPSRPSRLSRLPVRDTASRPPPNAVTYDSYVVHASAQKAPAFACWSCSTPLHWNTPQCSHCGVFPGAHGWDRTS